MKKVVRISSVSQQDEIRQQDTLKMTPSQRVEELIRFQNRFTGGGKIERVATIKRMES